MAAAVRRLRLPYRRLLSSTPADTHHATPRRIITPGRIFGTAVALSGAGLGITYLFRPDETRAFVLENYTGARDRIDSAIRYFTEPSHEKLLPDPIVLYPGAPPVRTLVVDLNDTLVHSRWTRAGGWRTTKRPGVEAFLAYLSSFYEIVVFTSDLNTYADPVLEALDPSGYVQHRLYRHATRFQGGVYIKDLSKLNRDLQRVILIDTKAEHSQLQPENAILLPEWRDNPADRELIDLIPFLESIVRDDVKDVRELITSYQGSHIPTEFSRRKAQERPQDHSRFGGIGGFTDSGKARRTQEPPTQIPEGSIWGKLRPKQ